MTLTRNLRGVNTDNGRIIATKLGDLVTEAQAGFATGDRVANGVIQVRMNNVATSGKLDLSEFIRVPADGRMIEKYALRIGDVLFNNTNSAELVGKTAYFHGFSEAVVYSNHFTRLRTKSERLYPGYLAYWLRMKWAVGDFERMCNRWIGQAAVPRDKLLSLEIPLPSLVEQQRVVSRLDGQTALIDKARDSAKMQLAELDRLPTALLRMAFSGGQ